MSRRGRSRSFSDTIRSEIEKTFRPDEEIILEKNLSRPVFDYVKASIDERMGRLKVLQYFSNAFPVFVVLLLFVANADESVFSKFLIWVGPVFFVIFLGAIFSGMVLQSSKLKLLRTVLQELRDQFHPERSVPSPLPTSQLSPAQGQGVVGEVTEAGGVFLQESTRREIDAFLKNPVYTTRYGDLYKILEERDGKKIDQIFLDTCRAQSAIFRNGFVVGAFFFVFMLGVSLLLAFSKNQPMPFPPYFLIVLPFVFWFSFKKLGQVKVNDRYLVKMLALLQRKVSGSKLF